MASPQKILDDFERLFSGAADIAGGTGRAASEIRDVKNVAVGYAATTVFLQLISTAAVVTVAYVTWQNFKRRK